MTSAAENDIAEHRALVTSDKDNPQMHRAWCSCGWTAGRADYGMADAWRRAHAHGRAASRSTSPRTPRSSDR